MIEIKALIKMFSSGKRKLQRQNSNLTYVHWKELIFNNSCCTRDTWHRPD